MAGQDRELVERCLKGDQSACEALYAAHAGVVKAYFLRSGFPEAAADDLTQEAFVRAFGSLATFDADRGRIRAWLAAIARNVARREFSRRQEPQCFDPELAEETFAAPDNPGQAAEGREEARAVRECVDALPGELARIVGLRYVNGRTTRGIAAATGIPEATVRLRLGEAKEMLAECLQEKGLLE